MDRLPVLLILASCFTHASWNLIARRSRQEVEFFRRMLILFVPASALVLVVSGVVGVDFPPEAFLYAMGAGLFCGLYFFFLGMSYQVSDFTVVYPVARALPVLLIAVLDNVLLARRPSALGWLGMVIVTVGCIFAPQKSLKEFSHRHYTSKTFLFIFLTAAATVGFTMLDKRAAEIIRNSIASANADPPAYAGLGPALAQTAVFHMFAAAVYVTTAAFFLPAPDRERTPGWLNPFWTVLLGFLTYTMVLWAFQMEETTAYLVAFRQFSIVVGVVAAFAIYKEKGLAVRLPASLAIVAGLVLVALSG